MPVFRDCTRESSMDWAEPSEMRDHQSLMVLLLPGNWSALAARRRLERRHRVRRRNASHPFTTWLVEDNGLIAEEAARAQNDAEYAVDRRPFAVACGRSRGLHRGISEQARGECRWDLSYNAGLTGRELVQVGPSTTSRRRHEREGVKLDPGSRKMGHCAPCGYAAKNIMAIGILAARRRTRTAFEGCPAESKVVCSPSGLTIKGLRLSAIIGAVAKKDRRSGESRPDMDRVASQGLPMATESGTLAEPEGLDAGEPDSGDSLTEGREATATDSMGDAETVPLVNLERTAGLADTEALGRPATRAAADRDSGASMREASGRTEPGGMKVGGWPWKRIAEGLAAVILAMAAWALGRMDRSEAMASDRMDRMEIRISQLISDSEGRLSERMGRVEVSQSELSERMGRLEVSQAELSERIGRLESRLSERMDRMEDRLPALIEAAVAEAMEVSR